MSKKVKEVVTWEKRDGEWIIKEKVKKYKK